MGLGPGRFVSQTRDLRSLSAQRGMTGRRVAVFDGRLTPLHITGCQLWLDASDASTVTSSSGSVSQWNDLSGNGFHVSQALTALQPTTGTRTLNGLNVIDFAGAGSSAGNCLRRTATTTAQPWTCIWVGKWDNIAINGGSVAISLRDGVGSYVTWTALSTSGFIISDGGTDRSSGTANTAPHVFARVANSANTMSRLRIDGTQVIGPTSAGTNNGTEIIIGSYNSSGLYGLDGYIGEVAIYDRDLADAEIRALEDYYFRPKWGL